MNPFFSVIIPLYNKEKYIGQTIKSLLDQAYENFEVLIINDGSTDSSKEIVKHLIDKRCTIYDQKNEGASHARNRGVKNAIGQYIALLDADDFWHENHLLELKKLIETFPTAGLFCNNYEINYNEKFVRPAVFNFKYDDSFTIIEDYFNYSMINSIAWTSSVGFSKETFKNIGEFNTSLRTGQDIDLWIRFALKYSIAFNPSITMRYNNFDSSGLSKSEYNEDRYALINGFKTEEQKIPSLKKYLDMNRFALAIRCKLNNELELYKKLKKEIDYNNLNVKQNILIALPTFLLKLIKRFQRFLISIRIYLTSYS